jgi:hypothetical protein
MAWSASTWLNGESDVPKWRATVEASSSAATLLTNDIALKGKRKL